MSLSFFPLKLFVSKGKGGRAEMPHELRGKKCVGVRKIYNTVSFDHCSQLGRAVSRVDESRRSGALTRKG